MTERYFICPFCFTITDHIKLTDQTIIEREYNFSRNEHDFIQTLMDGENETYFCPCCDKIIEEYENFMVEWDQGKQEFNTRDEGHWAKRIPYLNPEYPDINCLSKHQWDYLFENHHLHKTFHIHDEPVLENMMKETEWVDTKNYNHFPHCLPQEFITDELMTYWSEEEIGCKLLYRQDLEELCDKYYKEIRTIITFILRVRLYAPSPKFNVPLRIQQELALESDDKEAKYFLENFSLDEKTRKVLKERLDYGGNKCKE